MRRFCFEARDESATTAFGAALSQCLPTSAVIALYGTLGAGKTRLVQAIAEAAGVDRREVASPSFVLIHEYSGKQTIYHIDAYRIRDEEEFLQLGPEEYFESPGWTLIEWADRVEDCLPTERLDIRIDVSGIQSRQFEAVARGAPYTKVVEALEAALTGAQS